MSVIGVPNPVLWGIVGAVLRFVPYAGAFIAAALPLALAAAVDPGWSMVAETAVLFVVVEGVMGKSWSRSCSATPQACRRSPSS